MATPLPLDNLIELWKTDAPVNHTEPGLELLKVPNLHAKYVEQHALHSRALREAKFAYNAIRRLRSDYYMGHLSAKELSDYGWTPFLFKIGRDLEPYLQADPEVHARSVIVGQHEDALTFLDKVVKELNNRSFELRGYMDYLRWSNGQN